MVLSELFEVALLQGAMICRVVAGRGSEGAAGCMVCAGWDSCAACLVFLPMCHASRAVPVAPLHQFIQNQQPAHLL